MLKLRTVDSIVSMDDGGDDDGGDDDGDGIPY